MSESNPAPIHEDSALADVHRLRERAAQIGPSTLSEERRQLLKKFRRERLKGHVKQFLAAAAFLAPVCLLWTVAGSRTRASDISTAFSDLVAIRYSLLVLTAFLVSLTVHVTILWMIWRKVGNPEWELPWSAITVAIFFLALTYLGFF